MKSILKRLIEQNPDRSITYEQFMDAVLYHPDKGYYQKPHIKIGKDGDFLTSPSVHEVFGRTLARFLAELAQAERLPLFVCELGAGDGRLAAAILHEWRENSPSSFHEMRYFAIEGSSYHRQLLLDRFSGNSTVHIYDSLDRFRFEQPSFLGIVFSNEFFDALPVRVVENIDGMLYEVKVTLDENGVLAEVLRPCEDQEILDWIDEVDFSFNKNERIEIPLAMTKVLKELAEWLEQGALLTIDYGYTDEERKHPERRRGSLRGYHNHRLIENPLANPGEVDLTAHLLWGAYDRIAEKNGLNSLFMGTQRQFLLHSGILNFIKDSDAQNPFSNEQRQNRAVLTLLDEGSFGHSFQAVLHGKCLEGEFLNNWLNRRPIDEAIKKGR